MADAPAPFDLAGKTALVTGASAGIGAGIAEALAAAGVTVGICARREPELAAVLERCRAHTPDSRMWTIDLGDLDGVQPFALQADDELGGIDILVNNAGIPKRRLVLDMRLDELDDVNRINFLSPARLTMALLPRMVARGGGRVLTISSVAARLGPPHEAAYAAAKAGISAFMESAAVDLDGTGVVLQLANPGVIDTGLFHLPDNEDSLSTGIEALPVSTMADAVVEQLRSGAFEIYVPGWFADLPAQRYADVGAFIDGSRAYVRSLMTG